MEPGFSYLHSKEKHFARSSKDPRLRAMLLFLVCLAGVIIFKLFMLMIIQHDFYTALAAGSREVYNDLFPQRGKILMQDSRSGEEYVLAMNRDEFVLYADTREIKTDEQAEDVAEKLAQVLGYDKDKKFSVYLQLKKQNDPYEPLEKKITEELMYKLQELSLPGIGFVRIPNRYYPEDSLAAHITGFVGKDDKGNDIGRYGIEGYWDKELTGSGGFVGGAKGAVGSWIPLAGWSFKDAVDGADVLLTIDRTVQYQACQLLAKAKEEYGATEASLVVLEPETGAIRAMCGFPDFNPNTYNEVSDVNVYNNTAIFTPYEPGSIFKPMAMSAVLNENILTPDSVFNDTGSKVGLCSKPIKNAGEKSYGTQTMTGVLENSINTGMIFVVEQLGKKHFQDYLEMFGFGIKTGIELDSESSGTIDSLFQNKKDKVDCYTATASFGQGITVTPLQMASAFGVVANGGKLMKPYIVQELRYSDGKIERFYPKEVRQVLDNRTAWLVSGMLVKVVDQGQAKSAQVKGYYVAGKTGTAQIPGPGGYTDDTNHSFVGFVPVDNPKFVIIIKFAKPQRKYADSTAAPVFSQIADILLKYYQVPPNR